MSKPNDWRTESRSRIQSTLHAAQEVCPKVKFVSLRFSRETFLYFLPVSVATNNVTRRCHVFNLYKKVTREVGTIGPFAGFHSVWGALSGPGSDAGITGADNDRRPCLGARPVHLSLRQLAGTLVVSTHLLSPALLCVRPRTSAQVRRHKPPWSAPPPGGGGPSASGVHRRPASPLPLTQPRGCTPRPSSHFSPICADQLRYF